MSIKYRDSATSAEWKEIQNTTIINKSGILPDFWYDGQIIYGATDSMQPYYVIDTSNYNTLSLTYDYNAPSSSAYCADISVTIHYGYIVGDNASASAPAPKLTAVDDNAKHEKLFDSSIVDITGATVELDVSNYTSIVLAPNASWNSSVHTTGNYQYGYIHFYNIHAI